MDLIDEEDVTLLEARENRRQVSRVLDRRARGQAQRRAHLGGDDHREGGLAQPGWSGQQDVIGGRRAHTCRIEDELQLASDDALPDELGEFPWTQGGLGRALEVPGVGCDDTHGVDVPTPVLSHGFLPG